jgi:hypothetical protein
LFRADRFGNSRLRGEKGHMDRIFCFAGSLRYNESAIDPGAQTERRGDAGPVRALLGGETSPAAFLRSVEVVILLEKGFWGHDQELRTKAALPVHARARATAWLLFQGRNLLAFLHRFVLDP